MRIVLASASPRRREILCNIGLPPDKIIPSDADESIECGTPADETVKILSERKAYAILPKTEIDDVIIASDTVVSLDDKILGKPKDRQEAFNMLKTLSGKVHSVYTGVCIVYSGKKSVFCNKTDVEFYTLTDNDINSYLDTGEPFDKAGAYGIQGRGAVLVKRINGDFFSVMGLPASQTYKEIKKITDE